MNWGYASENEAWPPNSYSKFSERPSLFRTTGGKAALSDHSQKNLCFSPFKTYAFPPGSSAAPRIRPP